MNRSTLLEITELLKPHYGAAVSLGERYAWTTLIRVVVGPERSLRTQRSPDDDVLIDEGRLRSARETAKAGVVGVTAFLEECGRPARAAKVLWSLARWWLEDPDREAETAAAWDRPVEALRNELRAVPGVNLTLADRILLHVGGLAAFPVDRSALRIAGRHGWMDVSAEHEEWQSSFPRAAAEADVPLADIAFWFATVGRDYCGPRARCEQCPLRRLLPASGPLPLSDDEP